MDDRLEQKLYEHESKLVKVETILERVAINQDKMAEVVAQISTSIIKQELILEKLSHLETNSKGSFERVHNRVDKVVMDMQNIYSRYTSLEASLAKLESTTVSLEKKDTEYDTKFNDLELFAVLKKYPVLAVLLGLGVFSLTFEPIRTAISDMIGLFM